MIWEAAVFSLGAMFRTIGAQDGLWLPIILYYSALVAVIRCKT